MEAVGQLWLMQLLWGFGPWLIFGTLIAGMLIAFHYLNRIARRLSTAPIGKGGGGAGTVLLNTVLISGLIWVMRALIVVVFVLTGISVGRLWMAMLPQTEAERAEIERLTEEAMAVAPEMSLDFILLLGALGLTITATIGVLIYRGLHAHAMKIAAEPRPEGAPPPLTVRLYARPRFTGILLVLIACYVIWSFVMQVVYGIAYVTPLPRALTTIEIPGALGVAVGFLILLWLGFLVMLVGPVGVLLFEQFRLLLRGVRENAIIRGVAIGFAGVFIFFFGFFANKQLQYAIGLSQFPEWFGG